MNTGGCPNQQFSCSDSCYDDSQSCCIVGNIYKKQYCSPPDFMLLSPIDGTLMNSTKEQIIQIKYLDIKPLYSGE